MFASNPAAALLLDRISADLLLLQLLDAPFLALPEMVLAYTARPPLMPFHVGNLFTAYVEEAGPCKVSQPFEDSQITCNVFGSFGEDIIIYLINFVQAIVFTLLAWKLSSSIVIKSANSSSDSTGQLKANSSEMNSSTADIKVSSGLAINDSEPVPTSQCRRFAVRMLEAYGMRLLVFKLHASSITFAVVTIVSIIKKPLNTIGTAALMFSCWIWSIYIYIALMIVRLAAEAHSQLLVS